ncbi:Phage tail sheath protein [Aneurinibacillus thermoaerophilus]|uniref:Phage tail sheath protein n=1 Tax=Aneurinibacillus thermoaerophilus TaxID=143495 RepID=A0A1G8EJS8_ANETH|nr:hypothetical protein [Aneurinibacillus thermoaerophilus]SDH70195.1 Phage tail sheath protein [Aneurinibacillus thermoaerophilus]
MPVLRGGQTADDFETLDIYFEEQVPEVPEKPLGVSQKVMGIIGYFQKGSPYEVHTVVGEKEFKQKMGDFIEKYTGSRAAYAALKRGVQKLILVNLRGNGAAKASITLKDRAAEAQDTLIIRKKDLGEIGNDCTVKVTDGDISGTFTITLTVPNMKPEIYSNLSSVQEAVDAINKLSPEFEAENANSKTEAPNNIPAVIEATKLAGGSDGTIPTTTSALTSLYKGGFDSNTGNKTGLELMKTSMEVTDITSDIFVSDAFNEELIKTAEKKNAFAYLPTALNTSPSAAAVKRETYDTEFAHLSIGHAKSKSKGWYVPVAVCDCIAHILTPVQDGTAGFTFADIESLDVPISDEDVELLTKSNVVCMSQIVDADGQLRYGLRSDYTLSKDKRLRQTYRRRVTSLIEKDYYIILAPYRSKHISPNVLEDVEAVTRKYFDDAKTVEIIQDYQVFFTPPEKIGNVDEFIEDLTVDLYNIADKIRVRLLSAADAM